MAGPTIWQPRSIRRRICFLTPKRSHGPPNCRRWVAMAERPPSEPALPAAETQREHEQECGCMQRLRKAIFPVAGLGARFLPATKAIPKEMLPIVDKPLIQYAVEEARAAGIEEFIFVSGRGKTALEDHFDFSTELNDTLR